IEGPTTINNAIPPIVAGSVTPVAVPGPTGIAAGGDLTLDGNLSVIGDLRLAAGGALTPTAGPLTVDGTLSGASGGNASLTTLGNLAPNLGTFLAGGTLTLVDTPLTVTGPVRAGGDISITAAGQLTLAGGSFTTPGNILFQVNAVDGPAQFVQTG